MMSINLIAQDKLQRQRALDVSQSFIVQAPAGSGKTELLIQRFLVLLNYVNAPEEILAITFTKKAANEMRLRVINALKMALSESEPSSDHARQTWRLAKKVLQRDQQFKWHLINNPNQLRIQTIDSLCSYLTKQLPLLSNFGASPEISENPQAYYKEAVQEVLLHIEEKYEWSTAIEKLLVHLDNDLNKLHDLLINLLAKRDQWLPYIQLDVNDIEIRKKLENHIKCLINDCLKKIAKLFPKEFTSELIAIARFAATNLRKSDPDSEICLCLDLNELPNSADKKLWLGLAKLLLTKEFEWRKRIDSKIGFPALSSIKNSAEKEIHLNFKKRLTALLNSLEPLEDLRLALTELFFLPEHHYQETQWDTLKALFQVLKIVAAQLRVTFQQYGKIDFIENAQAALLALGTDEHPTDLALSLDYQIKHILVDEFQDTSFTQYQLLEKLTMGWHNDDGRTLFVVGDPMQSIYRFREAEVGLFIRMCNNGIGQITLTPLTLSINFRSSTNIVDWNNRQFKRIFPEFNDVGSGAVTYSPSVANALEDEHSNITVQGFIANSGKQAEHIISLIHETKNKFPQESIAILVRSRPQLSDIIPALKKANISYRAVDIDELASRQTIQDLLSLTCALLHPADRIAWLAILRAPWCGLTLADLLIIAGENPYTTIFEQLTKKDVLNALSQDGQQRIAKAFPILKSQIANRERNSLRFWIESTWLLLGGPACLNDISEMSDINAFFNLLDEYYQSKKNLNLDELKEKINQLFASAQYQDNSLQIMTIHSAKGLEFDTVILPHLERKFPADEKSLLTWMEQPLSNNQIALLLAPIHATGDDKDSFYEYIQRQQRIKSAYETDRLFYVATTRAKKRLHLFFDTKEKADNEIKIGAGSFLEKIWPALEINNDKFLYENNVEIQDSLKIKQQRQFIRMNSTWKNIIELNQEIKTAFHQTQTGFKLTDNQPKIIGVTIHRVLQLIGQYGIDWWRNKSLPRTREARLRGDSQQYIYLEQQLIQSGIPKGESEIVTTKTLKIITNMMNDPRGIWILQPHQEARCEYSLTTLVNGKPKILIIDRTFVDNEGNRWIIDYKTTTFSHSDLEIFLEKEQQKYLEKMRYYHQALQLLDNRPIRLGLYFPALPAWKDWQVT